MGPILSSLVSLQSIEMDLRGTRKKLRKTQMTVKLQEQRIDQLHAALKAKQEEIKLTHLQAARLELELKTADAEIGKLRVALNGAKTNKDYSAILTRINTDKADKSKLEEQILSLMTLIETCQASCKEITAQIEAENARLVDIRKDASEKEKAIQEKLDLLIQQKEQAAADVPEKERQFFERLADRYEGEVLVELSEPTNRRGDRNCGGCYMGVTLECVNTLMSKDEVVICPNCGRIMVLDKNPMQQPAKS